MISERRLVSTFLDLVRINAPAKQERPVAIFLKKRLQSYALREDGAGKALGGNCGNIIVRVPGDSRPTILLSAHMDTVSPTAGIRPSIKRGMFRSDGNTILGADDRAGIAMILELLAHWKDTGRAHPPLEIAFTVAEEIGLQGAKQIGRGVLKSAMGYVLDSSLPVGAAVNEAVTHHRMILRVQGRTAHAGVEPEKGINAICIAAKALSRLPTGRITKRTTCNVGVIAGGTAFNVVPSLTQVDLEIRSASSRVAAGLIRRVRRSFREAARKAGGKVAIKEWKDFEAFRVSPRAPVAQFFRQGAGKMGLNPSLRMYGGGSDGNIFNRRGIPCLVLGLGYKEPHTARERMAVADLMRGTQLLAAIMEAVQ